MEPAAVNCPLPRVRHAGRVTLTGGGCFMGQRFLSQVHRKIREDSDMAQDSLQCLAQLASLHGPVFPDEAAQVEYLARFIEGLLSTVNG